MRPQTRKPTDDAGFMLLAVIVMIFLVLLALSVAAPRVASELRRERELESEHRAHQYTRAIEVYYKKFGHYPSTLEQLDKTNNQRFLRAHYLDPLTGQANWRLIHVGENKTKVKGLFGQDLPGLGGSGIGSSNIGSNIGTPMGGGGSTFGSGSGSGSGFGSSGVGSGTGTAGPGMSTISPGGSSTTGNPSAGNMAGAGTAGTGSNDTGTGTGTGTGSDSDSKGGFIMGVGSAASGDSILQPAEQATYQTWEFLYDPRIEQLKAKWNIFGGGLPSVSSSSLGSLGTGSTPQTPTQTPTPATPTTPQQ